MTARQPSGEYHFCPYCGSALERQERGGRERGACPGCGYVAYRNPAVGVAVVIRRGGEVLLGLRRGSYGGMWCIPCGYVEWDEDLREAATREFEEETGLRVRLGEAVAVHSNFHNPAQHTVGVWFSGEVIAGEPVASDDLADVRFFSLDALPENLAFPTDRLVLEQLRAARTTAPAPRCS
ncbi:MAG: NUDIX domain-containing protein [Dehalococcoidia bacterium]